LTVPAEAVARTPTLAGRTRPFRVVFTGDFTEADGRPRYRDIGLDVFDGTFIETGWFSEHRAEIGADQLAGANGVIVLTPRVTGASLAGNPDLLAVGRFGVGYDSVDVAACTAADVLLFIAAGAVDRPVAEATIGWMLALSHHMRTKDKLVREARWDGRSQYMGTELRDRTLGVVGFGGIGRALVKLLAGFGMKTPLVFDPFVKSASGVRLVSLDELLRESDFVSVHCPLNDQTRDLISTRELRKLKHTAYLINTARGGIVNEFALDTALREHRIAGAAIDCFENEPLTAPPSFADLDNVLLAPHCIAWTDELFRDIGRVVCRGMLDLAAGRVPKGVVNREVLDRPGFQAKWKRIVGVQ
jgi:phosphoglycerate dehydrogenase-like enzyme